MRRRKAYAHRPTLTYLGNCLVQLRRDGRQGLVLAAQANGLDDIRDPARLVLGRSGSHLAGVDFENIFGKLQLFQSTKRKARQVARRLRALSQFICFDKVH